MSTSTPFLSADDLLANTLVDLLTQITQAYPGVVLEGVAAGPWLATLLNELGKDDNWCLTLVGADSEAAQLVPDLGKRTGLGAEHAVAMRNENVEGIRRLAVKLGDEARLHSLTDRGYHVLGPDEIGKAIAKQGIVQAPNAPQKAFWEQLAKGQPVVPIWGLVRLAAMNWAAPTNTDIRLLLPELGLLPDKALFNQLNQVGQRLVDNESLLERLIQQDPDDIDLAFATCRKAATVGYPDVDALRGAYAAFRRLNPAAADFTTELQKLDATLVGVLLSGRVSAPPPTPGPATVPPVTPPVEPPLPPAEPLTTTEGSANGNPPTHHPQPPAGPPAVPQPAPKAKTLYNDDLDEVILKLSAEPKYADLWEEEARTLFDQLETKLDQPKYTLEGSLVEVTGVPNSAALMLTQHFAGLQAFGGILPMEDDLHPGKPSPVVEVTLPGNTIIYTEHWLTNLRRLLGIASELVPGFTGETKLDEWLRHRTVLAEYASLLTVAPLTSLLARPALLDAARLVSQAYEDLLDHIRAYFNQLDLAGGAAEICNALLSPDIVALVGPTQQAALLSPLHPLSLWKYASIADELLAGRGAELLPLLGRLDEIPEPLRALMLPGFQEQQPTPLAFARRISAWVQYQQTGPIEATTNGKIIRDAARKLAILYPMVRRQLRILVHHVDSLDTLKPALNELVKTDGPEGFVQIHLILTHRPGQEMALSLSPLDELIVGGTVIPERIEIANINKLAEWLQMRPAHLLVLPGQRRLEPFLVSRQATDLHPLSLPHTLQYNRFKNEVSLLPRSQQRDPNGPEHPFGSYHELASTVGRLPNQEVSGAAFPRVISPDLPIVLPYGVFIIAGAPVEPPPSALALARPGGSQGDLVVTQFADRFIKGVDRMLTNSNYQPSTKQLFKLLQELEEIGRTPLFNTISAKTPGGFDAKSLKGQLGQAVALRWYAEKAGDQRFVVISLDSALARRSWLAHRESERRNDLLGIRRVDGGGISLDLIEVKSHEMGGTIEGDGTPGEQLRAVARDLLPVVSGQSGPGGKLVTDCRREALRVQLFQEGQLRMPVGFDSKRWADWIQQINQAIDGQLAVEVNLLLIEILFNQNEDVKVITYEGQPMAIEPEKQLKLTRVRLSEPDIRRLLGDIPPAVGGVVTTPGTPDTPVGPARPIQPANPISQVDEQPGPIRLSDPVSTDLAANSSVPTSESTSAARADAQAVQADRPGSSGDESPEPSPVTTLEVPAEPLPNSPVFIHPLPAGVVDKLATSLYRGLQKYDMAPSRPIDPAIADVGPSLIRLKVYLKDGKKVADIQRLATDLQREMELDLPPVIGNLPGTQFVSVEVGRRDRQPIRLGPVLAAEHNEPPVSFPVGVSTTGQVRWLNLPRLPHMLIGGTTGAGKTMFLYGLIQALSQLNGPETVEFVLIDPKQTDFVFFESLPHLRDNRVVYEPDEAVQVLTDLLETELPRRTGLLRQYGCRDIHEYRQETRAETMPFTIVVIDEFADLIQSLGTRDRKQFEENVGRLAQRTRSVGIHLVVATQRPDMKVIPGNLKNNLDCRIAFRLSSGTDSRVILDEIGAEDLLGAGDMLLRLQGQLQRLQGFYVPSADLKRD